MGELRRNDKVYVLEPYTSRPKMSMTVKIPVGRMLIIKYVHEPDEFSEERWMRVDFRHKWGMLPVDEKYLFRYTRIGELLYG